MVKNECRVRIVVLEKVKWAEFIEASVAPGIIVHICVALESCFRDIVAE